MYMNFILHRCKAEPCNVCDTTKKALQDIEYRKKWESKFFKEN